MDGMKWYVILAKDREVAMANLRAMGFETYMPTMIDHGKERTLFGNYMFVKFDIGSTGWQKIWNTRGVRRIICMNEDIPSPLPCGWVEALKAEGVRVLDDLPFEVGNHLRVKEGPFAGHAGFCCFSSQTRICILLHLLGGETRVYFSSKQLELDSSAVAPLNATNSKIKITQR